MDAISGNGLFRKWYQFERAVWGYCAWPFMNSREHCSVDIYIFLLRNRIIANYVHFRECHGPTVYPEGDKETHWKLFIFIWTGVRDITFVITSRYIISWCGNILHVMNLHTHSQIQWNPDRGQGVYHSVKLWSCFASSGGLLLFVFVCVRQRLSGSCSGTIALRAPPPCVPLRGERRGGNGLVRAGSEESSRNTPVMMRPSGGLRTVDQPHQHPACLQSS